jgi:hypothetical protein
MSRYNFSANSDGEVVLRDLDVARADSMTKDLGMDLRVARAVRVAAEARLVEIARDISFNFSRPMSEALKIACERNPRLLRLSRARIAHENLADITAW